MTQANDYDREAVESVYRRMGLRPPHPKFKKKTRAVRLSDQAYDGLKDLARDLGYEYWKGASVSDLCEAIGLKMFTLEWRVPAREDDKP